MHFCYLSWLIILAGITNHDEYSLIYETLDDKEKMSTLKKGSTIARMERKKLEEMKKKLQTDDECEFGFIFLLFFKTMLWCCFLFFLENLRVWIIGIEFQLHLKLYITYFTPVRLLAKSNWKMHDALWQQGQQFYYNGATVVYITAWYQECIFLDLCDWLSFTCCCCRVLISSVAFYILLYTL